MSSAVYSNFAAPLATGPLSAEVALPGSKSLTNRELVLSALANSPTKLTGALVSRDSALMIAALEALGAGVQDADTTEPTVRPATFDRDATIDCGLAGTVMRFVPPISTLNRGLTHFDGDAAARRRNG
jgi:3-phosphoshikimate 1-carboxyvinyltransferase